MLGVPVPIYHHNKSTSHSEISFPSNRFEPRIPPGLDRKSGVIDHYTTVVCMIKLNSTKIYHIH